MRANIIKDIRKTKEKLIQKVKKKGIYENFGQKEYAELKDKWARYLGVFSSETNRIIQQELDGFFDWCINYCGEPKT